MKKKKSKKKQMKKIKVKAKFSEPDLVKKSSEKNPAETKKPESKSVQPKITPYPQAGKKVAEFETVLDRQLAGDSAPPEPKRGPGRPPKEPDPEPPELSIDVVAGVVKIPFELWSISQSVPSLSLTTEEANKIAEPAKQLLEFYLPQIPVIAYAWASLSVSVFWIMQSRLRTIQEIKLQRAKRKAGPGPTEPAQPGVTTTFPKAVKTTKI